MDLRNSKGFGLHGRVFVGGQITNGREKAPLLAKWLAKDLNLHTDNSVPGRQSLDFWALHPKPHAFELVLKCHGKWCPPKEAFQLPALPPATYRPMDQQFYTTIKLSYRTLNFLQNGALVGERNYRLFVAGCDYAAAGATEDQAIKELLPVATRIELPAKEALATIHSAFKKPRLKPRAYYSSINHIS
jgi:hypothetical protein